MRRLLVAFYDKKSKSWSDVVTCPNLVTAGRMAEQLTKREGTIQNQYPEDFDMYQVGEYIEDNEGHLLIKPCETKVFICTCYDFKES